jgi:hypothetical protein
MIILKITIYDEDLQRPSTLEALDHLAHTLGLTNDYLIQDLSQTQSCMPFKNNQMDRRNDHHMMDRNQLFISPQDHEIDQWTTLLKSKHQNFVKRLKNKGQLSLIEVAKILNIEPSNKNIKKHINGSIGSILRWSKDDFLNHICTSDLSDFDKQYVKFLPPWYCDQAVYYWRILDRV